MSNNAGIPNNSPIKYLGPNSSLLSVVTRNRSPTSADVLDGTTGKAYPISSFWIVSKNPTTGAQGDLWYLSKIVASVAYWVKVDFVNAANFPITPYVVGPVGQAGYQTIQTAINAAHAAGGGQVWIQAGTYTEDLTLYTSIQLSAPSEQSVTIIGTHTLPASGTLNINRMTFQSATNIFTSSAAGTTAIIIEDCTVNVTNGYTFNIPNFTSAAQIQCFNIGNFGTNDGFINNTAGCQFYLFAAGMGNGTGNVATLSGTTLLADGVQISCPVNFVTGASVTSTSTQYTATVTISNNASFSSTGDSFIVGAVPAITMSSSANSYIANAVVSSSNNPAISGAGAGTLSLVDISFLSNSAIAGTLTLGTSALYPTKMANGQLLIGSVGQPAVAATIIGGTGISVTNGPGSISIAATTAGVTSVSGTTGRISVSPTTGAAVVDIDAAYIGQSSITTLGTVSTGTWSASTIAINKGGTNATSYTQNDGIVTYNGTSLVNYASPQINSSGVYTSTSQPAFLAVLTVSATNVTGNGADYAMSTSSGGTLTEVYDQSGSFVPATGVFTAPVTGKYYFKVRFLVNSITAAMTGASCTIIGTSRTFQGGVINPSSVKDVSSNLGIELCCLMDMTAGDTASAHLNLSGGVGDTAGVSGGVATNPVSWFEGYLLG